MELLMYVKERLSFDLCSKYISKIQNEDSLSLMDLCMIMDDDVCNNTDLDKEDNEIYTKSKKKRDL